MIHKKKIAAFLIFSCCWLFSVPVFAQDSTGKQPAEMAGVFRSNGKIYVVIVVLLIILTGIVFYLTRLDRKIKKFEKELK